MANVSVKNSTTGSMGTGAAKRSRFEKSEVAYGKIPAAAYASTNTLIFDQIPSKEIIYGRLVTSEGHTLEVFNGTDLSSALAWTYNSSVGTNVLDIHYVVTYIRGTGKPHTGLANATLVDSGGTTRTTEVAGEQGKLLKVTVTIT
jgi:hypothetical protein